MNELLYGIPILICVKGISKRCPNKNRLLLPFAFKWLSKYGLVDNVVIISNDNEMLSYCLKIGFSKVFYDDNDCNELVSCLNYIKTIDNELFFLFPITQPFKDISLFDKFIDIIYHNDDVDFVTSKIIIKERNIFYVNDSDNFIIESDERKGSLCSNRYMLDGSLYLIRKSFLYNNYLNNNFWKGNFKSVLHNNIFLDIDDEFELESFFNIIDYYGTI